MKPDLFNRPRSNRLRSLVKASISSLALIAVALVAAPYVLSQQQSQQTPPQQTPEDKDKPPETKKPEEKSQPEVNKLPGFFDHLKINFDIGGHIRQVQGDRPGKFQETRDFPKGFYMRNLYLNFESADSPFILSLKALEIRERDQSYSAEAGRVGKFRTRFLWDQVPHYYSDGRSFYKSAAPGVLTVSPALRASLEAAPNAGAATLQLGNQLPDLLRQQLPNEPLVDHRVRWDNLLLTHSYYPTENLELYFRAQRLHLNGVRPKPTGTFARQNFPPINDALWEALGSELLEPVDYRTTNVTAGIRYSRPNFRIGLDYDLSLFRNSIQTLRWENPFRVTDALAIAPAFGVGRNRFAQAQLALPPDNDYQSVRVYAGLDLPRETQLRGAFTWGRGTQNEPFLPYTLNSAMVTANLLPGQPSLFNLALPQSSLNGVVHTMNHDYALASRPWKNMRFLLQYRANDIDNQSQRLVFPGLPAFGDSTVRTAVDFYNLPIENFPTSYTRQNTTAIWELDPLPNLGLKLEYDWEIWNRRFLRVPRTNEHSVRSRLDYKLTKGVLFKADYLYSHRLPRFYPEQPLTFNPNLNVGTAAAPISGGPGWEATPATKFIRGVSLEFNQLRQFDVADRIRNDAGVSLDVIRWEKANFSVSYRCVQDAYDKDFYGLRFNRQGSVDAQLNYFLKAPQKDEDETTAPDKIDKSWVKNAFMYVNYSRQSDRIEYRGLGHLINGAAINGTACCALFPIANTFDRDSKVNLDMFQFGINTASEGERTVLDMSYVLAFASDKTHAGNPFPILAISPRTATAYDYPDGFNWQQEVNFSITHQLRPGIALGISYLFEPYRLDDYYTNSLQAYQSQLPPTGGPATSAPPVPRYLFANARFTSYHANVATVFLRYSFGGAR